MAEEAGASRIAAGLHFAFSNTEVLEAGGRISNYVYDDLTRPLS